MPIYHYGPTTGAAPRECETCAVRFEVVQPMSEPALTACPACGAPVMRTPTAFGVGRSTKDLLKPNNLAAKGFTQYRRGDNGQYEKTAGNGPATISRD